MSPPIVLHVKRWISKSYSHCWKGFKYAENFGKPKNVQELEDFSEEKQTVELLRTNKGLMDNYHNTEKQLWIIQETTHIIKIQGYVNIFHILQGACKFMSTTVCVYIYIYIYIYGCNDSLKSRFDSRFWFRDSIRDLTKWDLRQIIG